MHSRAGALEHQDQLIDEERQLDRDLDLLNPDGAGGAVRDATTSRSKGKGKLRNSNDGDGDLLSAAPQQQRPRSTSAGSSSSSTSTASNPVHTRTRPRKTVRLQTPLYDANDYEPQQRHRVTGLDGEAGGDDEEEGEEGIPLRTRNNATGSAGRRGSSSMHGHSLVRRISNPSELLNGLLDKEIHPSAGTGARLSKQEIRDAFWRRMTINALFILAW